MVNSFLLKVYQCSQAHNIYILFFNIFIQLLLSSHDLCVINKKDYYFVLSYSTILSFNPNEKEPQIIHYFLSCLFEVENIEQKTYHLTTFKTPICYSTTFRNVKKFYFCFKLPHICYYSQLPFPSIGFNQSVYNLKSNFNVLVNPISFIKRINIIEFLKTMSKLNL